MKTALEKQKGDREANVYDTTNNYFSILFEDSGRTYLIDKKGEIQEIWKPIDQIKDKTPGEFEGDGTENSPYLIQSIEDLVALSNNVSPVDSAENGKTYDSYEGKVFRFEVDLDFRSRASYVNPDSTDFGDVNGDGTAGTLFEEMTTGSGFREIGKYDYGFSGTIDGNNKELRNLYIANIAGRSDIGFIGHASGSSVKVSNLTLKNVNITKGQEVGGIIGRSLADVTIIENCTVTGEIEGSNAIWHIGGLLGYAYNKTGEVKMSNNINEATINSKGTVGGIIGRVEAETMDIASCKNKGKINVSSSGYVGGIIGEIQQIGASGAKISNCSNEVELVGYNNIGGIVGGIQSACTGKITVEKCYNTGNITGTSSYIAGISAFVMTGVKLDIIDCYNTGNITTQSTYLAGILARGNSTCKIEKSYNTGDIKEYGYMGGILGSSEAYSDDGCSIKKCYNKGNIIKDESYAYSSNVGGIAGKGSYYTIDQCYNTGMVQGSGTGAGGIAGYEAKKITNSYNTGAITGEASVGGIAGYISYSEAIVMKSYNTGKITFTNYNCGGIIGYFSGKQLQKTYNFGDIIVKSTNSNIYAGAIDGYIYPSTGAGIKDNAYLAGTYTIGVGINGYTDSDTTTKKVQTRVDLCTLANTNLTTTDGWKLEENSDLPVLDF